MSTLRVNNLTDSGGTGPTYATGHTIQTVSANLTANAITTSTTYVDTGLSVTITPKSASSNILILFSGTSSTYASSGQAAGGLIAVTDSSDVALQYSRQILYLGTGMEKAVDWPTNLMAFIPAGSTSSRAYKIRIRMDGGGSFQLRGDGDYKPRLTVMEVAA